jgi:nudix-type nucleoside diphosphatase (YffH/AdpP family)
MIINRDIKYKGYYQLDDLSIMTKKEKLISRELLLTKDGVGALVYDTKLDRYVLISQWRPCLDKTMVEIVGGSIDEKGGDPIEAIKKEVEEEIGYKTDNLLFIDDCFVSPGSTTEFVKVYYIEVSEKTCSGGGSEIEDEELDVVYMTREELLTTKFYDAKTIIAINWLKCKLN